MDQDRPAKKVKLFSEDDDSDGGVPIQLSINEEYAKRFEHNKKRAERHRLEEKYGKSLGEAEDDDDSLESSDDEEEDEDGELLATGTLDDEIHATIRALKNRDPCIYDPNHKFYSTDPDAPAPDATEKPRQKPTFLSDYHRQNLIGDASGRAVEQPKTYGQEQEDLRKAFLEAADDTSDRGEGAAHGDADGFLERKQVERVDKGKSNVLTDEIRSNAKQDPDRFLSAFIASKAWREPDSKPHVFESDEEDFDDVQEQFENDYNMRFEKPEKNGKIQTFSRDAAAQYSVRKDMQNRRQRARDTVRQQKDEEKQQRAEEKALLRKLRLEEAQEKLNIIKEAAGIRAKDLDMDKWSSFLTGDWDDSEWQRMFNENFGDKYYAEDDQIRDGSEAENGDSEGEAGKRKKPKKPKFDDDIDITDLVPDFDEEEQKFTITDDEDEVEAEGDDADETRQDSKKKRKKGKDAKKEREEAKREARKDRRKLEAIVDEKLDMDLAFNDAAVSNTGGEGDRAKKQKRKQQQEQASFRYRDTSPVNFGMTASDILMATDTQLNQFAGIKKLASFRQDEKKKKDRKRLGKKARLRQWRQETFGDASGPRKTIQDVVREAEE